MKLLTYLITLSFFIISCDALPFPNSGKQNDILIEKLTLSQNQFNSVDEVKATFKLTNTSTNTLTFEFPSGCQYGFTVTQDDSSYIDSRRLFACTMAFTELTFKSKESKSFSISLEVLGEDFVADFEPGEYQLNAFLLEGHSNTASASFVVVSQE